ncbi:MAG: hypothetical protein LC650_01725 [Actinobacteria bacterium]|nr:hypothetical protein [Actinomycetota bacterium]
MARHRPMTKNQMQKRVKYIRESLRRLELAIRKDEWDTIEADILLYIRGDVEVIAEGVEENRALSA